MTTTSLLDRACPLPSLLSPMETSVDASTLLSLPSIHRGCVNSLSYSVAREHLVDCHLRSLLWSDPFEKCPLTTTTLPTTTRSFSISTLQAVDWAATCFNIDGHQLQSTFDILLESKLVLTELDRRRRQRRLQGSTQRKFVQQRQQQQPSARKVPRKTLLSDISDYEEDLEEDFFSELIEQVRLPTFTLEEYYEEESEDDEEETSATDQQAEFTSILCDIRMQQRNFKVLSPRESLKLAQFSGVDHKKSLPSLDPTDMKQVQFTFKAFRQKALLSFVAINATQCRLEDLHMVSIEALTQSRYEQALQRWLRLHNKDPILESFQQVPFPHCNIHDLQLLALDVLHQRRLAARPHKFDPTLHIVATLLLQTPMCDLHDLLVQPMDQLHNQRRERSMLPSSQDTTERGVPTQYPAPNKVDSPVDLSSTKTLAENLFETRSYDFREVTGSANGKPVPVLVPEVAVRYGMRSSELDDRSSSTREDSNRNGPEPPQEMGLGDNLTDDEKLLLHQYRQRRRSGRVGTDHLSLDEQPAERSGSDAGAVQASSESRSTRHSLMRNGPTDMSWDHETVDAFRETDAAGIAQNHRTSPAIFERTSQPSPSVPPSHTTTAQQNDVRVNQDGRSPALFTDVQDSIAPLFDCDERTIQNSQPNLVEDASIGFAMGLLEGKRQSLESKIVELQRKLDHIRLKGRDETLDDADIGVLRKGCDWEVSMDDFESIDTAELLWHSWASDDAAENDELLDAEEVYLRESGVHAQECCDTCGS